MSDRLLPFEAIENFRDFGGYAACGGRLKRGLLFRSAQLSRATPDDLQHLDRLGLATVIDLRRASERRKQPDRLPQGWAGQMLASDLGGEGEAPHIRFLKTEALTEDSGYRYMEQTYSRMPFDPAHVELFRQYFARLADSEADSDGGVLVHCAAGKDRTGVLVALTHALMGVSQDDILHDYLETNRAVDLEGRAGELGEKLSQLTGRPVTHQAVVAFLGVRPEFLEKAFDAIGSDFGTLETYAHQCLGLDAAALDGLRRKYIES